METRNIRGRIYKQVSCSICGNTCWRRKNDLSNVNFCSRKCFGLGRKNMLFGKPSTLVEIACSCCGKQLVRKPSEMDTKSDKHFCSKGCLKQAMQNKDIKVGRPLSNTTNKKTGRARARRWFVSRPCEICGEEKSQRHHKDGNPLNNLPENIAMLCAKHHVHADRLDHIRRIGRIGAQTRGRYGKRDVYGKFISM